MAPGPSRRRAPDQEPLDVAQVNASIAERDIAWVRFAVITINIAVYFGSIYPAGVPWLAIAVSVVAFPYALSVPGLRLYDRLPALRAATFTAWTDGVLIVAWLAGTGGGDSPFHLLWFVSIVAVAARFRWGVTIATSIVYAILQAGFLHSAGRLHIGDVAALLEPVYIVLTGTLGALTGWQFRLQVRKRVHLTRMVEKAEAERMVADRQQEVERLREQEQFRTRLLNTASHELNTPLTPISLQLHLLASGAHGQLTPAQAQSVRLLTRNMERLADLVADILQVARMQSNKLNVVPKPIDLREPVQAATDSYLDAFRDKGLRLELDLGPRLPVLADPRRIEQVCSNLLSNAHKFTDRGVVRVSCRRDGDDAVLEVEDSGIGIPQAQRRLLFQPFSRVHDEEHLNVGGTGLGLYICRGLAEHHGGGLEATSRGPGLGSTFTLRLPILAEEGPNLDTQAPPSPAP